MFRALLLFLFILSFFTACSIKAPIESGKDAKQQEKAQNLRLLTCLKAHQNFEIDGQKVLKIIGTHYQIYSDIEEAPIEFGTLIQEQDGIRFKSLKRNIFVHLDGNCSQLKLVHPKGTMHLKPIAAKLLFYEPKTLFEAIKFGTLDDIKRLRARGASYDIVNDLGSYPLIEAVYYHRPDMVRYMISDGADLTAENGYGFTALHQAIVQDDHKMIKLLLSMGAKKQLRPCSDLIETLKKSHKFSTVKELLDAGFDPNCQQSTLLFWVITNAQYIPKPQAEQNLKTLLTFRIKADVISNELGDTPLMRAAAVGDENMIRLLVSYGENIQSTDRYGRTALDYDSLYLRQKNPKVTEALHQAGLNNGIKVRADKSFNEAQQLLKKHAYLKAYQRFVKLSDTYKQKRFYVGRIKAASKLIHPNFEQLNDLIQTYAYLYNDDSNSFYLTLISYYQKMLKTVPDDVKKDRNGNFKSQSKNAIRIKIDTLYQKLLKRAFSPSIAYDRLQNLYGLKPFVHFSRIDITNIEGIRYVGESYDKKTPLGKGALKYPNGGKYIGSVINYIRHGKGKMIYPDGSIYDGAWVDDKRHGTGFYTDKNNAMYIGSFVDDKLIGTPKLVRKGR